MAARSVFGKADKTGKIHLGKEREMKAFACATREIRLMRADALRCELWGYW
jgi:hypothetical protein